MNAHAGGSAWFKPRRSVPSPAQRRYRNLTFGLLAVLVLPPFLRQSFPGAGMVGPLLFVVIVARATIKVRGMPLARAVLTTAMAAVALRGARVGALLPVRSPGLELVLHLFTVVGFTFVVYEVLRHVLADGPVNVDKLYAAVSAYLLIGLAFASVYEALAFWEPGSFSFRPDHAHDADGLMYFSLVTLSTVGYGDVVPVLPQARVLAVLEAILGQLYLAVLMARLVGLHLSQASLAEGGRQSLPDPGSDASSPSIREAP
jgi:voltage-gated potassium channel